MGDLVLRGQALCHYRRLHGGAARRTVPASKIGRSREPHRDVALQDLPRTFILSAEHESAELPGSCRS